LVGANPSLSAKKKGVPIRSSFSFFCEKDRKKEPKKIVRKLRNVRKVRFLKFAEIAEIAEIAIADTHHIGKDSGTRHTGNSGRGKV